MAIASIEKVNIVLHQSYLEKLLNYLQKSELLEIISLKEEGTVDLTPSSDSLIHYEYNLSEVKHFLNIIKKYDPDKLGFIEGFIGEKEETSEKQLYQNFKSFDFKNIIKEAERLENELGHLESEENDITMQISELEKWTHFKYPISCLKPTSKFSLFLGNIPAKYFKPLEPLINDPFSTYEIIKQDKLFYTIIIAIDKDKEKDLLKTLEKFNFIQSNLSLDNEKTVKETINELNNRLNNISKEKITTISKISEFVKYKKNMTFIYDYLTVERGRLCVREHFWGSKSIVIIEGWMIKDKFSELQSKLKTFGQEIELLAIKPEIDEKMPVVIQNPPFLSPFEVVTKIFGNPKHDEIDPTLSLSFFFILFFAICLGDAGYGFILALMAIILKKKYKLPPGVKKLVQLFLYCGLASIPIGALTGSWFGISINDLPPGTFKSILVYFRIIDPLKNPLIILGLSLALGVIQVLTGITMKFYCNIRNSKYKEAFLDNFLWFFFLCSLLFLIATKATLHSLDPISTRTALIAAILLILTQGRKQKNIFAKFFTGLLSLYNTSSYMGDVLSYSRLLALGLTSTVIGMIVNIIALLAKNIPFVGWIIMLFILIIGHLFNVIVSTLGAFIHSARLQLVEYFGKFFEGGGRVFRPFRRETKYTVIRR